MSPLVLAAVLVVTMTPRVEGARAPRRATHAFTVVSSDTPRLMLLTTDARFVHLALRNDGVTTWTPSNGFALSYHWRTVFNRMVQRDGTRTPIPAAVPPGGTLSLVAELGPAPRAGVYVLEWDMVQESVTWFSERDPAPLARSVVLVLPGAAFGARLVPALPALVAALGFPLLWACRRPRAPRRDGLAPAPTLRGRLAAWLVASWDLTWCTASLFFKQLALFSAAHLHLTGTGALMLATVAVAPALLLYLFVQHHRRASAAWAVAAVATLVLLADEVYFRFFGDFLSIAALSATAQAGHLRGSVWYLLQPTDAWLALDLLVALPLVSRLRATGSPPSTWRPRALAATALGALILVAVPSPVAVAPIGSSGEAIFQHLGVAERLGILGYHLDDAVRYLRSRLVRPRLTEGQFAETRQWFAEHARQRAGTGPYFGAARGRNVVLILVESLQGFVVGLKVNGQEVTPNLNRLRGESLWSAEVVDQVSEGRTSDAELLNAASLLPLPHGAAAFQYPGNHFVSVPQLLARARYHTFSAVPFDATFWNRSVTHPSYGFSRSFFKQDFEADERVGWGLNDRSFLRQMQQHLRTSPRPFCAWMITLSLHHPFDSFPDGLKSLRLGAWEGTRLGNYLHAMHLFDESLGEFLAMAGQRLLDDTLLVVEGDHEAGAPWDEVARAAGLPRDTISWYLADRVPLLIRVPGLSAPRGELRTVAGQADIAPTLLALLGIDPAPLPLIGRNLLGTPGSGPVLRRYGDWIDSRHLYLAGQAYTTRKACFDVHTRHEVPLGECRVGQSEAVKQAEVSQRVLTHGLQEQLAPPAPPQTPTYRR